MFWFQDVYEALTIDYLQEVIALFLVRILQFVWWLRSDKILQNGHVSMLPRLYNNGDDYRHTSNDAGMMMCTLWHSFYTMKNAQLITSRPGFVGRKHRQLKLDEALKGYYTDFSNIIQHEMHLTSRCRLLRCGWWFNVKQNNTSSPQ